MRYDVYRVSKMNKTDIADTQPIFSLCCSGVLNISGVIDATASMMYGAHQAGH
jgi:hypothetical protein